MSENTCGTCRHFGTGEPAPADSRAPKGFALCGRIVHADHVHDPRRPKSKNVCVVDRSGYYAALCVTTDFGCTEWEEKPQMLGAPNK